MSTRVRCLPLPFEDVGIALVLVIAFADWLAQRIEFIG
jgi:hypothetical protein